MSSSKWTFKDYSYFIAFMVVGGLLWVCVGVGAITIYKKFPYTICKLDREKETLNAINAVKYVDECLPELEKLKKECKNGR